MPVCAEFIPKQDLVSNFSVGSGLLLYSQTSEATCFSMHFSREQIRSCSLVNNKAVTNPQLLIGLEGARGLAEEPSPKKGIKGG